MRWTYWILYLVALPWNLFIAWPVVLLIRLFWGKGLKWERPPAYTREHGGGGGPVLTCQIREGTFPVTEGKWPRGWYLRTHDDGSKHSWGGTSLGHGIFYGSNVDRLEDKWLRVQAHEHIHTEQFEMSMVWGLIMALVSGGTVLVLGRPYVALGLSLWVWINGYLMMGVAGWLTAILRGEPAYWGSTHEESARAQDDDLAVR